MIRVSRFRCFAVTLPIAAAVVASAAAAHAQTEIAVHTVNDSGVSYGSALTAVNTTFTTSFKGSNDVTITLSNGSMAPVFSDSYSASAGNNPAFLTDFVGSTAQGTGNGTAGDLTFFNTNSTGRTTLQYDFAQDLVAGDELVFSDLDVSEQYSVQAYTLSGGQYVLVNMNTAVTSANYTGEETNVNGGIPNSSWAKWTVSSTPTKGIWYAGSSNLNRPANVLTFNEDIARVTITSGTTGSQAGIQFLSTSEPVPAVPEPGVLISAASMAG